MIQLFTIGFTRKSAEQFFTLLRGAYVQRILDIRLHNVSQLAGFTKQNDLRFFLRELCHADDHHLPCCAPTAEMLSEYEDGGSWESYETEFNLLMRIRRIETVLTPELLDHGCLLCGEPTADHCHRRLVAEYLEQHVAGLTVTHL